jgi:hypothetical protein
MGFNSAFKELTVDIKQRCYGLFSAKLGDATAKRPLHCNISSASQIQLSNSSNIQENEG